MSYFVVAIEHQQNTHGIYIEISETKVKSFEKMPHNILFFSLFNVLFFFMFERVTIEYKRYNVSNIKKNNAGIWKENAHEIESSTLQVRIE